MARFIIWRRRCVIPFWARATYDVLETFVGKDLEYKEYEPLFDYAVATCEKQHKKAFYIVCDNYVTLTDGTGVVHIAPAFGEDDCQGRQKI